MAVPLAVLKTIQFEPDLGIPVEKLGLVGKPELGGAPYAAHTRDVLDDPKSREGDFYYEVNAKKGYIAWKGGVEVNTKAITHLTGSPSLQDSKFSHDWGRDPFALGSYSLNGVDDGVRDNLSLQSSKGLCFVGEYVSPKSKVYMEGAINSV